jgi:phosphoglucosamine mutase
MIRFGTDGVRGLANAELTPEFVMALGRTAARVLGSGDLGTANGGAGRRRFIVGRDTRRSGPLLQAALSSGLASEGVDVTDAGVIATPAVAYLSAEQGVPAAVISASHNPYWDNGIKFFTAGGAKLPDDVEEAFEAELERLLSTLVRPPVPTREGVGHISSDAAALSRYQQYVLSCLEDRRLDGLRVALDCANGAAFASAPAIFEAAGAQLVEVLAAEPNGMNINDGCGSTAPGRLAETVVAKGADLGLAFDGDADRVIAVDAGGNLVDGDRLIALFATDLAGRGLLNNATVVVTVMTNLGFHQAMAAAGVKVHTVSVGDRYVLEALDANGWSLGGEQSGHIIFRSLATTGDGVLSGLLLADLVSRRGDPLDALAGAALQRLPQVLRNVAVADRDHLAQAADVWEEVRRVEDELGQNGRVLLRPSGTEPLVRVMVEAPTQTEAESAVERIVNALQAALGPPVSH